jgi:protein TonB
VVLQLLVGTDGKVTDSKIEGSSGYERLDKAAQAALSRCRFTPGTVDGVPAPAWAQIKYTFKPSN